MDHLNSDAQGDLLRGLQVVETAAGIPTALLGNNIEGMSYVSRLCLITRLTRVCSKQRYGYFNPKVAFRCVCKCCALQLPGVSIFRAIIIQNPGGVLTPYFQHDSTLDDPNGRSYWKHTHLEALRT